MTHRRPTAAAIACGMAAALTLTLAGCAEPATRSHTAHSATASASAVPSPNAASAAVYTGARCPAEPVVPPKTALAAAAHTVVPFVPATVLICSYGQARRAHTVVLALQHTTIAAGVQARRWAMLFNTAKAVWTPGVYNCPADFGAQTDAFFRDLSGDAIEVAVTRSGCAHVLNGTQTDLQVPEGLELRLQHDYGAVHPVTVG